jgi:hypothetical protein
MLRNSLMMLPRALVPLCLQYFHEGLGHPGSKRTLASIMTILLEEHLQGRCRPLSSLPPLHATQGRQGHQGPTISSDRRESQQTHADRSCGPHH